MTLTLGKTEVLLKTAAFLCLLILFVSSNYAFLVNQWLYKTAVFDEKLRLSSQLINDDVANYLAPLNKKFQQQACSKQVLQEMRFAEYHSNQLHEYGFLNGQNLLCSTSRGILEKPITQPLSDIKSPGNTIEFTQFTDVDSLPNNIQAMSLRFGNFQALIRPENILMLQPQWMQMAIFVFNQDLVYRVAGTPSIQPISKKSYGSYSQFRGFSWYHQSCYFQSTCAVYKIDIAQHLMINKTVLSAFLGALSLLFYLLYVSAKRFIRYHFSFNRQVFRGLNTTQILCYYQPIINNLNPEQSYCEVLCRWQDCDGAIHGALPFLAEVTANNQTALFTKILITKAVQEFKQAGFFGHIKLSINSFPQDISQGNIEAILEQTLSSAEHASIIVEITEQQAGNHHTLNSAITELHKKGVKVAIDDFGTGYANLEQLTKLKVDYLKIDQSFVFDILENQLHLSLIEHIIKLANELDLTIVAEGVETQDIQSQITRLNIKYSQGYFHAKPMPLDALISYYKNKQ